MISETFTINSTAQKVLSSLPSARTIYLHVMGNGIVYLGDSTVTTSTGTPLEKHTTPIEIFVPPLEELWAIDGAGGENLRLLRPSADGD